MVYIKVETIKFYVTQGIQLDLFFVLWIVQTEILEES